MATGKGSGDRGVDTSRPTHTGKIHNQVTKGSTLTVKLVETEHHWVTCPGRLFFRKDDGLPRGRTTCATWVLDLATVRPVEK